MKTTFFVLIILVLAVEISSERRKREPKLPRERRNVSCSTRRPCSSGKFCLPFVSKCTGGNKMFSKSCYIDEQCPADQICSIVIGYCVEKPSCRNTKPYSFCRKDFCPCPDGYKCQGEYNHQKCLPVEVVGSGEGGSGESGSGEAPIMVVN